MLQFLHPPILSNDQRLLSVRVVSATSVSINSIQESGGSQRHNIIVFSEGRCFEFAQMFNMNIHDAMDVLTVAVFPFA